VWFRRYRPARQPPGENELRGEPEADANRSKISVTSPIARALIGKNNGNTVEVEAPGGAKTYKVWKVEWLENGPGKCEQRLWSGHR
jgi:Transcription elongation factor, GreA/GreB, C-term